jgi:predicted nucleic acid-binding protein
LFFPEVHTETARALVADAAAAGEAVLGPRALMVEFVNIARRKMRLEKLSMRDAAVALDGFLALPVEYRDDIEIYRQALILTERYSLSGFDAQYVALAQLAGCELWVDDERLLGALRGRLRFVRRLADYRPQQPSIL